MLPFTGIGKPPSTVAVVFVEKRKSLKKRNCRANSGLDTNYRKTINKRPCIWRNSQGGRPTALKSSTKKGKNGSLNLAGKYSLYKVNLLRGGLHTRSIPNGTSSPKPEGIWYLLHSYTKYDSWISIWMCPGRKFPSRSPRSSSLGLPENPPLGFVKDFPSRSSN